MLLLAAAPPRLSKSELFDPPGHLRARLWTESRVAAREGRKAYLYVHAGWCDPCVALQNSIDTPLMQDAFLGVRLLMIDFDRFDPWLARSGFLAPSIPKFFELDRRGRPTGRTIDGGAWGANVPSQMAPPLKAFFRPG